MIIKIKYVEMTPAEYGDAIENGEKVEYCYVVAKVIGDEIDDAVIFWAVMQEFNVLGWEECNKQPQIDLTADDFYRHSNID